MPFKIIFALLLYMPPQNDASDLRGHSFSPRGSFLRFFALCFILSGQTQLAWSAIVEFGGHQVNTDRLLVKWRSDASAGVRKAAKADVISRIPGAAAVEDLRVVPRVAIVRLSPAPVTKGGAAADPLAAVNRLRQQIKEARATGQFEYVEPDYVVQKCATPTDSAFTNGTLWALRNTGQSNGVVGADIRATSAWDLTTGSTNVVVAVIDTGIRYTHQDLAANMWRNTGEIAGNGVDDDGNGYVDDVHGINAITGSGNPMDDNDHGTHCAGTIGAVANGGGPHVGVAWQVRLMALKFLSASGSGSSSDAIKCIDYAVAEGADILSNSWGGGGYSQALFDSIAAAQAQGVLFVAAAGNSSVNTDVTPFYPASYRLQNVISVAATDRRNALASFSNYGGGSVHLGAPGVAIYSSTSGSDTAYDSFQGTSMACPHVAGVAALVVARFPAISLAELKNRLVNTTTPVSALSGRTISGGLLNADNALRATPDGVMEVSASSSSSPLAAGSNADFFVSLSDVQPVTNATVTGSLVAGAAVGMLDNGVSPDLVAGDAIYSARIAVPTGVNSVRLTVDARAAGKQNANPSFDFTVAVPPPNDNFANRIAAPPGSTSRTGSNLLATKEVGEPINPAGAAGDTTVWWTWTAPAGGQVRIDTNGSDYDTTLAVYRGSALGALTLVGDNDDDPNAPDYTSAVTFTAEAGVTYAVQVSGYSGAVGNIVLRYPQPQSVVGEPVITVQPADTTANSGAPFTLSVVALNATSYQWYHNNSAVSGATSATYAVPQASLSHEGVYHVVVSNIAGSVASREARLVVAQPSPPPVNDAFTARQVLPGNSGSVTGSNRGATGEASEPDHAGVSQPLQSAWFEWRAPANGMLTLTTEGSAFDTTLALYSGASVSSLTLVASNDDEPLLGTRSRIAARVVSGVLYRIAVDGYNAASGAFTLGYSFTADSVSTTNDAFASAYAVTSGSALGSNVRATRETSEPWHLTERQTGGSSVWWKWTAGAGGPVTVATAGSDFDTILAVYDGSALTTLRQLGSNDDAGGLMTSSVQFTAVAGVTYYIAVDGYARAEGNVKLSISPTGFGSQSPFEQWARAHGLDPAGNGSLAADADGDGYSNATEFAFGASPVASGSTLQQATVAGSTLTVRYLARTIGYTYVEQISSNLPGGFVEAPGVNSVPSTSQVGVPSGWVRMEFTVPVTGSAYYCVRAVPQ